MKVGIICECGPEGAEVQVLPELAQRIDSELRLECVTLDNKQKLVRECGKSAATLLATGCRRVVVVWDLYPAWRERRPCRREDRRGIYESLAGAAVSPAQVGLVCIREELEAWLVADGRAVSAVLSTPAHRVRIRDGRNPESIRNLKKRLDWEFQQNGNRRYSDRQHAIQLVKALPDLTRLDRIPAFARFRDFVSEGCS